MNFKSLLRAGSAILFCATLSTALIANAASPDTAKAARLTLLKSQVDLTPDQEAKAKPIIDKYVDDRNATKGEWAKLVALKAKFDRDINAILTPEQQKKLAEAKAAHCLGSYTINLTVELSSELTNSHRNISIELREGVVRNSIVVDTKQFVGHSGTVVFSGLCTGSYFIDIGNGSTVAVGPVHVLRNSEHIHSTIQVTLSQGNIGTMNRSQL